MLPLYSGAVSGMQANQQSMDITANNIANANTPGFDASDPAIQDLIYQATDPRNLVGGINSTSIGVGSRVEGAPRSLMPGSPQTTGNPLDVTITGDGYLSVTQSDGTTSYTRAGMLRIDGTGRFNIGGMLLQPPLSMPTGATDPSISDNGQVIATMPDHTQQVIGQIQLSRFANEQGLQAVGSTLFTATVASGAPIQGQPGQPGLGRLMPGTLESARVDLAREMSTLIVAERAYGLDSRVLQTVDRMVGDVTGQH